LNCYDRWFKLKVWMNMYKEGFYEFLSTNKLGKL
jgi:hypothetical protein